MLRGNKLVLLPLLSVRGLHRKYSLPCATHYSTRRQSWPVICHSRSDLCRARRVVVKMGSAVITREDECGLAMGRLASIVEQVAELQKQQKEMVIVTSGAVAFGKQLLRQETRMAMSLRESLSRRQSRQSMPQPEPRACAAVGQNGLMSMYDSMFQQYGFRTAQVLVNKSDFENECSRNNLKSTLSHLCTFNTIPIVNTNDAMAPPPEQDTDLAGVFSIKDNDSLAARLAVEMEAELLILMSDVDGLLTAPPSSPDSRLLSTFCPDNAESIVIGSKSRVGSGGMDSKVKAATWALQQGTSVVICNGCEDNAIVNILKGKEVGTFFTTTPPTATSTELQAQKAHDGGQRLQRLSGEERSGVIRKMAALLQRDRADIMAANCADMADATNAGLSMAQLSSIQITDSGLDALCNTLRHLAHQFCFAQGQVLKVSTMADMVRRQVTAPLGVVLVIAEGKVDALPQMAALAVCSGNGLMFRGCRETTHTNTVLHSLLQEAMGLVASPHALQMVSHQEPLSHILQLKRLVNLVVPLGPTSLTCRVVKDISGHLPVLTPKNGVCHIYIDQHVDPQVALDVVMDSVCQPPGSSSKAGTLLVHHTHRTGQLFDHITGQLRARDVHLKPGPELSKYVQFGRRSWDHPDPEEGKLQVTVELVEDVDAAITHINTHSSGHTDVILTSFEKSAEKFVQLVNSSCVFHNVSTRLSHNIGIEARDTGDVQAQVPVDVKSLLTTKWIVQQQQSDHSVQDMTTGQFTPATNTSSGQSTVVSHTPTGSARNGEDSSDSDDAEHHSGAGVWCQSSPPVTVNS